MDIYYTNKIDELFKNDIQSHESLKEKQKNKKDEQLELFSHLKRNLEDKNKINHKNILNKRKSINIIMNAGNNVLDNIVSHSKLNDQINNYNNNISSSKNTNKILLKLNLLRFCNTVGENNDKIEKNEKNEKKLQPKNINIMKFVDQNENNELESSNISFYDKFLKILKEDAGIEKENGKEKDKDKEKEKEKDKRSIDKSNKIITDDIRNNINTNTNINIINNINNINNPKSNSNNRNKYNNKSKNSLRNGNNFNLHSSCNLKKNKKQKNFSKNKKPLIINNKDKLKNNNENSNKHHNKKIQHLSQIPLKKANENKTINNSIENNNKFTKRRGSIYKQKKNQKYYEENNDVSISPVLKSITIKKKNFVKYYSYDDGDGEKNNNNNNIENGNNKNEDNNNENNNFKNENINNENNNNENNNNTNNNNENNNNNEINESEIYSNINEKEKTIKEKNSYHDCTSIEEDNIKIPNKRKHFNTQEFLDDSTIKGIKYDSDLTSKKDKLKKRKSNYMSIEQFMSSQKHRFEIVQPENLISLEFNGVNRNRNTNQVVIYNNNENFVNFDEKNETNDNVSYSENKKRKKKKIFCCI